MIKRQIILTLLVAFLVVSYGHARGQAKEKKETAKEVKKVVCRLKGDRKKIHPLACWIHSIHVRTCLCPFNQTRK